MTVSRPQPDGARAILAELVKAQDDLPRHRAATESELLANAIREAPLWKIARAIVGERI